MSDDKKLELKNKALKYHSTPMPGKVGMRITRQIKSRADLGLAYTPGVAYACMAIHENEDDAYRYTAKGNLVAVISNGTAVLGLGDIGAVSGKPVMEGKSVLFKYLAGIDSVDVEVTHKNADQLIDFIKAIAPTYGGINLEDVAAPVCFDVDKAVHDNLGIPFFHDDQSGTAVVVGAAVKSALKLTNRDISSTTFVFSGAGAAALACVDFLCELGANIKNVHVFDSVGHIHDGRSVEGHKKKYSQPSAKTMREALSDADVFIGLSKGNILQKEDLAVMAPKPIILAMANPDPEILPPIAREVRSDAIVGSGRSDFANQVNNVLCFPFLFRGALDCKAKTITPSMAIACCEAIIKVAQASPNFGPDNIMPDAFDPLLIYEVPKAVAEAAKKEGVATAELPQNYNQFLNKMLYDEEFQECAIPNTDCADLIRIMQANGVSAKSNKKLFVVDAKAIEEKIKTMQSGTIVFANCRIGYKNDEELQCANPARLFAEAHNPVLGIEINDELYFNNENRLWYAHKLCVVKR